VAYTTVRLTRQLSLGYRVGWLARPVVLPPAGRFAGDDPAAPDTFPDDPVFARAGQPNYLHGEAALVHDTRDVRSHPTSGRVIRLAWTTYSDRDAGVFSFARAEAEAAQFVPVAGSRVVLAVHGWMLGTSSGDGERVPFYLAPSLGGHNTLRGYPDYRFHDRHLLLVNAESRVALLPHVDAAAFVDAGTVAARLADLSLAKTSYGVGLRMHSRRATFARMDVAHGGEGWRVVLRLSDPLHLSRFSRETAAIPFVP
jgi:outer membrane protein assembly factor BamA